jgi:hypothetical protein
MGLEAKCTVSYNGQESIGNAHLETDHLTFRGDFKLDISFKDIKSVDARRGELLITLADGEAAFQLGKDAEKWMLKIRYPRGRLDKLGVKPGMRVAVVGVPDPAFLEELATRTEDIARSRPKKDTDVIFYSFDSKAGLAKLEELRKSLKPAGAIWTVFPKGQKHITQNDVMTAGKAAGLVDIKVVGFSESHSSLKWVIPVAQRDTTRR